MRRAPRQAVQSCTVASATQCVPTRRCSRTGSLSGALQAQQRWAAARVYASAVRGSGARDVVISGGAARMPGGTVVCVRGFILPGALSVGMHPAVSERRGALCSRLWSPGDATLVPVRHPGFAGTERGDAGLAARWRFGCYPRIRPRPK